MSNKIETTDSPFDDPSNPFQDPSITSALVSHRTVEDSNSQADNHSLSDFNATSFHHVSDNRDPFAASSTSLPAPTNDLSAREEALRQKERQLADRERDLEARLSQQPVMRGANNFPPCFPILYLDIVSEIPVQHQKTVMWLYREWLLFLITLVMNFFACFWVLFSHPASVTSAPADMGVALTELFTHTLASFFLWYRPVYNAYMKDNSLYFYFFFVFNGFHILYTFYMAIGIPSTGGAGLILLVTLFSDHYIGPGILTLLSSICWLTMGFMALFLYKKTYDHYKAAGHTFSEAKSEAYSHMGRSTVVRDAAVNAAWNSASRR
ncbi:Secretory carrier-associated membrane protein 2 [Choanephora cucurbitarum]|uniref:Secretory carrier-associated membrane protein 2 n=1 Tax=Choanephora cucurbitarum TaxID=101091 RepID=A0A1C7NHS7_9FUNG|nr:Secretory carrier-associated membrane protein 2 [Choanephora cucurbitarum]